MKAWKEDDVEWMKAIVSRGRQTKTIRFRV